MRLRMLLLIAVIILSSLVVAAAGGGGWWSYIDLEGQHLGIGETLTVRSEVWFRGVVDAQKASNSDYYAYLVRGIDREALRWAMSRPQPKRWWKPPAEMTLLGDVDLSQWDTDIARSTARLTIPELSLGRYHLMLCDRGCRNPLGNLIPARVEVVDDPLAAQTSRKLQDATDRTSLALARLRKDLRQSDSRVYLGAAEQLRKLGGVKANASETAQAVTALRKRLESLDTDPRSMPWPAYLAWFVGGLGVATAAARGRRRASLMPTETPVERKPDDARELATSRSLE